MHIVINTLSVTPNRGGVKTYLLNLLDGLLALDVEKRITLLCSAQNEHLFDRHDRVWACVEKDVLPLRSDHPALRILFDQLVVPLHCRKYRNAVLLSQASVSSLFAPLPEVVIIQVGLSVRRIREEVPPGADTTSWAQRLYYDTMLPLTLRRASQVVTVSDYLRHKITELYPRAARNVRTVYEGVDLSSFTPNDPEHEGAESKGSYLLFVGTLFPYKRADQAIRAFGRATARQDRADVCLKIVGKDPGEEAQRLHDIAHESGVANRVDILGSVPHEEMPTLYRDAVALVFPSTVETFGLPLLEAMASGTPVIASDRMSVPEVVGDAGLIVDPEDTEELADAICRVLESDSLYEELRKAGKKRARTFTWKRTARGVWKALEEAKETARY